MEVAFREHILMHIAQNLNAKNLLSWEVGRNNWRHNAFIPYV